MSNVKIVSQVSPEELFHGVEQLETAELDRFLARVLTLLAQRRVSRLTAEESALLDQVNLGLAPSKWRRYRALKLKRRNETLAPHEQAELVDLSDEMEQANVRRIKALVELAQLRQTSLDALMQELGIQMPAYE